MNLLLKSKMDEFDATSGIHQDILYLQVLVHNALLMAVAHDLPEESLASTSYVPPAF